MVHHSKAARTFSIAQPSVIPLCRLVQSQRGQGPELCAEKQDKHNHDCHVVKSSSDLENTPYKTESAAENELRVAHHQEGP